MDSTIPIGILIVILGEWIGGIHVDSISLIPLGIYPHDFYSADYYPIIPWLGYAFIGYGVAHYLSMQSMLKGLLNRNFLLFSPLAFMGRHSLLLYVAHVPVIYGILKVLL